jgi:DeoR family fructose operon transcriptional repressor
MQASSDASHNQIPANRHEAIYHLAKERHVVKVAELSELLGVTEMTIRRDLEAMERKGLLERTHGGAVYNDRIGLELLYDQKSTLRQAEKEAIGKMAASLIEEGDTVFLNSGSTTIQVIQHLDVGRVKVITNNPLVPLNVRSDKLEVYLTGGELRRESFTLVGETAMYAVRQVYANKAIIGIDGFSIRHGLTNTIQGESWLNRLMIHRTHGEVILVADSSKVGKVTNFLTSSISAISTLVTDAGLDAQYVEEFGRIGIKVLLASENRE